MKKLRAGLVLLSFVAPLLVLSTIWFPEFNHYYVSNVDEKNAARVAGNVQIKYQEKFDYFDIILEVGIERGGYTAIAEGILQGKMALPHFPATSINPVFDPEDLEQGSLTYELLLSGLVVPNVLLEAYKETGERRYVDQARQYLENFLRYERSAWLPKGFLWNDHAVVARVYALSRFVQFYLLEEVEDVFIYELLNGIYRAAEYLRRGDHYTYGTNHGVMQNLALLHVAVVFPDFTDAQNYSDLAQRRLAEQLKYYVSNEGYVLEHSPGYHEFGTLLVGAIANYLELMDKNRAAQWQEVHQGLLATYDTLRRPDGTLPAIGNTRNKARPLAELGWNRLWATQESRIYPVSGLATLWQSKRRDDSADESQMVINWSNFASRAHKHADELSLTYWSRGVSWITNVGYWPYGFPLQADALSWRGSNAPHWDGEPRKSRRETHLESYRLGNEFNFMQLRRREHSGYSARRQYYHADGLSIVIDSTEDEAARKSHVVWTLSPGLNLRSHQNGYLISKPDRKDALFFWQAGEYQRFVDQGSDYPFSGWVAYDNNVHETNSIVNDIGANGWLATFWMESADSEVTHVAVRDFEYFDAFNWRARVVTDSGKEKQVFREEGIIKIKGTDGLAREFTLTNADSAKVADQVKVIDRAYHEVSKQYDRYYYLLPYREKVSAYIIFLLLLQLLSFTLLVKKWPGLLLHFGILSNASWAGLGFWLHFSYFVV